jgi:V/A-type H+-transporting ATPase subunit E
MAENIKDLIEKIQQDGIKVAQDKARDIEAQAQAQAQAIIEKAKIEARRALEEARENISHYEESTKTLLKQAGRDMLISLKNEIIRRLDTLVKNDVRESLNLKELSGLINSLVRQYGQAAQGDIVISLSKEDCERLEKHFLSELKEALKKEIILKPSEDITAGFIISYDSGKSQFDFTDKAISEYISGYLKPRLKEILE